MAAAVPIVFSEALNVRAACKKIFIPHRIGPGHRNEEAGRQIDAGMVIVGRSVTTHPSRI